MNIKTYSSPIKFFYKNAGYSWAPDYETREQGRLNTAICLAEAEARASELDIDFVWEIDPDIDSSEFSEEKPWALWQVLAYDDDGNVIGSLQGVDFGRDALPWNCSYRRVVEAQVALEALSTLTTS